MSRVNEPSCKKCRRNRVKLFLKGLRCNTAKCSLEKRNFPPGKNAASIIKKSSDYGIRLREKQKIKAYYSLSEAQLRIYYKRADSVVDKTGHVLLILCERRLDNVAFRAKLARSRVEARALITHGHLKVNGKKVDRPSYLLKANDVVTIAKKSEEWVLKRAQEMKDIQVPAWLLTNDSEHSITVAHMPTRDEINFDVQEQFVVEYYSR